ncbi:MAG: peptidylprolyl isomerase [Magnetococcales bacterium]|nr:peptidylprolyl isomerase [Magnetococcales bacterium]
MTRRFVCTLFFVWTLCTLPFPVKAAPPGQPQSLTGGSTMVVLTTSLGDITIALNAEKAPISVKNFLDYVDAHFYDGTIFHRVIAGFMVQGGGFSADMQQKPTQPPIRNEADNGLKNSRGTIAMARTQIRDSATAQFFINLVDNSFLDHGSRDFGYAVFGTVVQGMEVVDRIAAVKTGSGDVPVEQVLILKIRRQDAPQATQTESNPVDSGATPS